MEKEEPLQTIIRMRDTMLRDLDLKTAVARGLSIGLHAMAELAEQEEREDAAMRAAFKKLGYIPPQEDDLANV